MHERFFKNKINPIGAVIINIGMSDAARYFTKYSIPVIADIFDVVTKRLSEAIRVSSSDVWKYCANESIILENTDVPGFVSSLYNANGSNTIKNIVITDRYFGNLNFSFLNLKINKNDIAKNRKKPSGRMSVEIPANKNDIYKHFFEFFKNKSIVVVKNNMNSGSAVPYIEFSINLGAKANIVAPIILYFFSTNRLHRKYNGNIIMLEIKIDAIRCNCIYELVSEKSKIENNPARKMDQPGFANA